MGGIPGDRRTSVLGFVLFSLTISDFGLKSLNVVIGIDSSPEPPFSFDELVGS